jgi:hypothetical protein
MVVYIVRTQYTSHVDAGAETVSETDSRPRQRQVSMLQSQECASYS